MSYIGEIKKLFENEIKKLYKKIETISKNYKILHDEHMLLLKNIKNIDNRVNKLEKNNNNKYIDYNDINYNDEGILFRKQISSNITNPIKNINIKEQIFIKKQNSDDKSILDANEHKMKGQEDMEDNKKKENKRRKKSPNKVKKKEKNNQKDLNEEDNYEKDSDIINNIINQNNIEEIEDNKNNLIIDNNNSINNFDIMTFGKNNNSILSMSINDSEFSFNPNKLINKNNINNNIKIKKEDDLLEQSQNQKMQNNPVPLYNDINNNIENIMNSDIIKNIKEIYLIITSIPTYNKFDSLPKFQKIFESSVDGDSSKSFHKFCDGEPNIIVVIESDNNSRFGGYTKIGFTSDGDMKNDEVAFLFSFDKMKIYKIKRKYKALYCNANYGPCFGDRDNKGFWISNNYLKEYSYVDKFNGYFNNMNQDYELNQGYNQFIVKKLEIFKILI